jgi:hypothetical protein
MTAEHWRNIAFMASEDIVSYSTMSVPMEMPIVVCDLRPLKGQLELARRAIEELRISHPVSLESNVKASYVSPWKSHLINQNLMPLCKDVVTIANEMSKRVYSSPLEQLNLDLYVKDCWGIVYEQSDKTMLHNHFPMDFGCAIYLEADEDCAPIIFANHFQFQPKTGHMVLFPGILNHEIPENNGRRTVVAMNLCKRTTLQALEA